MNNVNNDKLGLINSQASENGESVKTIFFEKPKILLIDVANNVTGTLCESGFNANFGTFGQPYKVQISSSYQTLLARTFLPNYNEKEIVVIDLKYILADHSVGTQKRPKDETDLWAKCNLGFIDPRSRGVVEVREAFNKILNNGGIFIIFANSRTNNEIKLAREAFGSLTIEADFPLDEWSFLDDLSNLKISNSSGVEMTSSDGTSPLGKLLASHLVGSKYSCTLQDVYSREEFWNILAVNKFGESVAVHRSLGINGSIIVLPQLADKSGFLKSLFTEILPEMSPHLFPNIAMGKWAHFPEYELPKIKQLIKDKNILEQKIINESKILDEKILEERSHNGWVHDLLTQTGDPLVHAIIKGLKSLGFKKVIDMDVERDKLGLTRREDLQIQDKSPILVVDIKGIASFPSDGDVLQANKHATLLMKEQSRTDINSLSIINHQRHLEPLQRDNILPFRQELLSLASELSMSLITSWDFYRLVINAKLNEWKFSDVQHILYDSGRSEIIPSHYKYIGKITKVWSEKFGVLIENNSLKIGQKIAIEFSILFEEAEANELVVEDKKVSLVSIGDKTGISWPINNTKLKEGMRVFSVN